MLGDGAAVTALVLIAAFAHAGDVPQRGAWLVVGALPIVAGSGTPARVFAVIPA